MANREPEVSYVVEGTAASSFHVPDTVDWSSMSAQTKNQFRIVPVRMCAPARIEPGDLPTRQDHGGQQAATD